MSLDPTADKNKKSKKRLTTFFSAALLLTCALTYLQWQYFTAAPELKVGDQNFLIKPYLQFGRQPDGSETELLWAASADESPAQWNVLIDRATSMQSAPPITVQVAESRFVQIEGIPAFKFYSAPITGLNDGRQNLHYTVQKNGKVVFDAVAHRLVEKANPESIRFDVAGDIASGQEPSKAVARAISKSQPNFVIIPGDIVYNFGRTLEYLDHFFPVYNQDINGADGAPLIRSTMLVAAPGNHDIATGARLDTRDLDRFPDGLAYFYLWRQPLNGPLKEAGNKNTAIAKGTPERIDAFRKAAGESYPRMANFSFDVGHAHFLMLDANPYLDWTERPLRQWVEQDLRAAGTRGAIWKFVVCHQPPFSSGSHHSSEQQMRLLSDVFEREQVDVVFSGHIHNYQRTFPMSFRALANAEGVLRQEDGCVNGSVRLDKRFDGVTNKHPQGVIYIISGGGGATLTGADESAKPQSWQQFTQKFLAQHSFTQCDISGNNLVVRQITSAGQEIDHFEISKNTFQLKLTH